MSEPLSISAIERVLLDRAITDLNTQIAAGFLHIRKAFEKFGTIHLHGNQGGQRDEVNAWFDEIKVAGMHYYGGYHLDFNCPSIDKPRPPEWLAKIIIAHEAKAFLEKVSEIDDVRETAERALHEGR